MGVYDELDGGPAPVPEPPRRPRGPAAGALAAAMLAVGEIVEPHKTEVHIEVEADDPTDDDPFDLTFGDLPPL